MLGSPILPGTAARWLKVIDLFPWTSSSSSTSHTSIAPFQLFLGLTDHYDPETHVESIIVKSIWYGKCQEGVRHEFLLIEIEDTATQQFNYLVLDRNNIENANIGNTGIRAGLGLGSRAFKGVALDEFRISRDGIEDQLMIDSNLKSRVYLEKMDISPEEPLYLYQLATFAFIVSRDYPTFSADVYNCYFVAGFVWEGIRKFRPKAVVTDRLRGLRGRFGPLLYHLGDDDMDKIYTAFEAQLEIDWHRLRSKASGSRPARKGTSEPWPEALFPKKSHPSRMATIEEVSEAEDEDSESEKGDDSALIPALSSRLSLFRRSRARLHSLIRRSHRSDDIGGLL